MAIRYKFFVVLTFLLPLAGAAQPTLNFKRVEVRYPEITLAFKVTCAGAFKRDMQSQHFEVRENGILVKDARLLCPPDDSCCVSTTMVLDRTGSMLDRPVPKLARLKTAAKTFVDLMQTPCDEASLVSFNTEVTVDVPMTTDKWSLKNAIDGFAASGSTALWDAAYEGITQLASSARNRCRAVVLFTDGGENSSKKHTFSDVITHALTEHIRVFTIGYGIIQGSGAETSLQQLAENTGGDYYYSPVDGDLNAIFRSIRTQITESYRECVLSYESTCPDGMMRTVELTLKNYCGGTVTQTRTYQAPLDRSKFSNIQVHLGRASVMGTREVEIPLMLDTPVEGVFSSCDFTIQYNRSIATLVGVSTVGTLLEGVPTSIADVGSGHTIYLRDKKQISGTGPLLFLRFRAGDVAYLGDTYVHISNWNMYAYCLIPRTSDGLLTVTPREPLLACSVDIPERIVWDDDRKEYVPNPVTATVRVANSGTREARNVKARISISSAKAQLSSPTVPIQSVQTGIVNAGAEGAASWDLRVEKLEKEDSIRLCFTVTSDNHEQIECCRTLYVNPAQASSIACALHAPDTVYFREQFYEPEEFDVTLTATNSGTGQTKQVVGQLLQDTRFTIQSDARLVLADVLPPLQQASGTYRVRMHPRETDGYDTLRAHVQGNDTDPVWCEKPVWVQRLRWPVFTLACTTPDNELEFSELAGDYTPNPFPVSTAAVNVGETYAEECQILFVGPPRFTPVGTNLRPAGTMKVGDRRIEQWMIRALPRSVAGWDTLVFQVLGKGGLGRKIALAECRLPIYVPEMRAPAYELHCDAPDSLRYESNTYTPDPFLFTMSITNTGTASGRGLRITPVLPGSVQLAAGETAERFIAELRPNESVDLSWRITPLRRNDDTHARLCARILDEAGISGDCCSDVFIPRVAPPSLSASCMTIDTVFIDETTGEYAGNPFLFVLTVRNSGTGLAENVRATLAALAPSMSVEGDAEIILGDIAAGAQARAEWYVRALRRVTPGNAPLRASVSAANHVPLACERTVFVPITKSPVLTVDCASEPEDSLLFNWNIGDYDPKFFSVSARVTNIGAIRANNVVVTIIVPPGTMLAAGETSQKSANPSVLEPGQSGLARWVLQPVRQNADATRGFHFIARASNASDASCSDTMFVQGAPRRLAILMPRDQVLRYGEKRQIPVYVDRTVGIGLSSYRFELEYDPAVLSILQITSIGTLTGRGWVGPVMYKVSDNRVRISDYSTAMALHAEAGLLLSLQVEGVYRGNGGPGGFAQSVLDVDTATLVMNSGEIEATATDGSVIVTDDCLEPLKATDGFTLEQNAPNPFTHMTTISYSLARGMDVRLAVYDRMGRELAVLAQGPSSAGTHTVQYDAAGLEPGLYFCRMETANRIEIRKMIRR